MKKVIIAFLLAVAAITLCACSPEPDNSRVLGEGVFELSSKVSPVPFTMGGEAYTPWTPDGDYFEVASRLDSREGSINDRFFKAVETKQQLSDLDAEFDELHAYTCDEWNHENDCCNFPFLSVSEEYNDEYFNENILILYYATEASGAYKNWIDSIEIQNETLVVNLNRFYPSGGVTCDILTVVFKIEIKKADIEAVENYSLVLTSIDIAPEFITLSIKDEFFNKVKNKSFKRSDFNHENILGVRYKTYEFDNTDTRIGYIFVELKEIGSVKAQEMLDYFLTLDFVADGSIY